MTPEKHNFWDIILKSFTAVALLCGGIWALYEHFDTEKQKVNSTFWNKRMELYLQTSQTAAAIAAANTSNDVKKEIGEFWQLYYGAMSVIEDTSVKNRMQDFAGLVRAFQGPGQTSTGVTTKAVPTDYLNLPAEELHQKKKESAKELADAMHISLRESWSKPFDR